MQATLKIKTPKFGIIKLSIDSHLAGLLAKAAHQGVTVGAAAGSIVIVLNYDGLLASKPAREQDYDLARLQINQKTTKSVIVQFDNSIMLNISFMS